MMTHLRSIIFIIVKKVVVSNFDENGIHFICNDLWKKNTYMLRVGCLKKLKTIVKSDPHNLMVKIDSTTRWRQIVKYGGSPSKSHRCQREGTE